MRLCWTERNPTMTIDELVEEFVAEQDRRGEEPISENDKQLLRKFSAHIKENGYLEESFYD